MDLEPVYADSATGLSADKENLQTTGIVSEEVRRTPFTHTIRTVGRVLADDTRVHRLVSGSAGWVKQITPGATGTYVHKGDLLATYYSRDSQTAQMTYIFAVESKEKAEKTGTAAGPTPDFRAQLEGAADNLLLLGLSEIQVTELARTHKPNLNIELRAPITGFIVANSVYAGLRFERGSELIRIADLSHVWITADLFRNETADIKTGSTARITIPEQNRSFTARVSGTLPQFDPASRTTRVRLELQNPASLLRPDMFVDVEFPIELPPTLHVSVDSVIGSGLARNVYVQRGSGVYDARAVETGWQFGDEVEIVRGIQEGERVVRSGAFLLDSETRMARKTPQAKDPVCGMPVSGTQYQLEYSGVAYRFCSRSCKAKFETNKDKYAHSTNAS